VRVLEPASKLTTFPLMVLLGHPAKTVAAKKKLARIVARVFMMSIWVRVKKQIYPYFQSTISKETRKK